MANIGDIKIVDVNGLPGFSGTSSGGGNGEASDGTGGSARSGNLADNVVSSALRYTGAYLSRMAIPRPHQRRCRHL